MRRRGTGLALVAVVALAAGGACGESGCCGCGGCDCAGALIDDYRQTHRQRTERELRDIDPIAHAFLRGDAGIVAAVGGSIDRIEYEVFLGTPNVRDGHVHQDRAKEIEYRVAGPAGTLVVKVIVVRRGERWELHGASYTHDGRVITVGAAAPFAPEATGGGGWD